MSGIRTMGKVPKPEFTRRINEDWSIHSYCSQCFATIVDASSPAQVESAEREHHCDPRLLEMVERYRQICNLRSVA